MTMTTLKQLQEAFRSGEEPLREDEYLGDDGLPYCKKCNTRRWFATDDGKWAIRAMCDCQAEEARKQEDEEKRRKHLDEFYNRRELSLLGNRYKNANFTTATITSNNLCQKSARSPQIQHRLVCLWGQFDGKDISHGVYL